MLPTDSIFGHPTGFEQAGIVKPGSSVAEVIQNYAGNFADPHSRQRAFNHPKLVVDLVGDFVGQTTMSPVALSAAWTHDLLEKARDTQLGKTARFALRSFTEGLTEKDKIYFDALIGDMEFIEQQAEKCRVSARVRNPGQASVLREVANKNQPVDNDVWLEDTNSISPAEIKEVVEGSNIESIVIKACELLANLSEPPPKDIALYQDTYEARYFYVPVLRALAYNMPGLDRLASAIDSKAKIICLEKAGKIEYVHRAVSILEAINSEVLTNTIRIILGKVAKVVYTDPFTSENVSGQNGILAGQQMVGGVDGLDATSAYIGPYRRKADGSLAWKLFKERNQDNPPADLVAATIITNNQSEVGIVISSLARAVCFDPDLHLIPSGKREEPVHVRGTSDFVASICKAIEESGYNSAIDAKINKPGDHFTVAKVTLEFAGVSCEVQVQDTESYRDSRVGRSSHGAYKSSDKYSDEAVNLEDTARRTRFIGLGSPNPASLDRATAAARVYA